MKFKEDTMGKKPGEGESQEDPPEFEESAILKVTDGFCVTAIRRTDWKKA
jgi:hypothetical protein